MRGTDGHGADWIKRLALADDYEPADGRAVMSYWEALDAARQAARGVADDGGNRPLTVGEALDLYANDLRARGGNPANAAHVRGHLSAALLARLVSALTAGELRRWRDSLLAKGLAASSVNRTRTPLRAALNLAAKLDRQRITNAHEWRAGLEGLSDANRARDVSLTDAEVVRLIGCARDIDLRFGLFVETLAMTGARTSQAARLTVADLQRDQLMMPTSKKGRATKIIKKYPVPLTPAFSSKLKAEAQGRPADAPLLLQSNGALWASGPRYLRDLFRSAVTAAGLDPDRITPIALRHSSIIRMLTRNVPLRMVASLHDTSAAIIESNYSAYIAHHADALARAALLDIAAPADNVVALPGRRP